MQIAKKIQWIVPKGWLCSRVKTPKLLLLKSKQNLILFLRSKPIFLQIKLIYICHPINVQNLLIVNIDDYFPKCQNQYRFKRHQ
jgi:hypothetical protein